MTNSPGSVRWLYSYLVHSVHSGVRLDMHDSLFKPIHTHDTHDTHDISRMIGSLFSEE